MNRQPYCQSKFYKFVLIVFLSVIVYACHSSPTESVSLCELTNPPSAAFSFVPPIGSFDRVSGVVFFQKVPCDTTNFRIALYVSFDGVGGICKPTQASPLTEIARNGTWEANYATGGIDDQAPWIIALLVTKDFTGNCFTGSIPKVDGIKVLARISSQRV